MIYLTEFSPFLFENYVIEMFPFLKTRFGKPVSYLMYPQFPFLILFSMGSFCLEPSSSSLGLPGPPLMLISGIMILFNAVIWFMFYYQKAMINPSDYRGFQHPSTDLAVIIRQSNSSKGEKNKINI